MTMKEALRRGSSRTEATSIHLPRKSTRMSMAESIRRASKHPLNDGDDENQNYVPFNGNGLPDKIVNANAVRNAFSEYKFTVENTAQFTGFMIKVVMTSTSQAKPPRLKNFRAIALRSFQIDD